MVWARARERFGYAARAAAVAAFNARSRWVKRGVALTPARFEATHMARNAAVHVMADGSVLVHHPGVEIGQARSSV